LRGRNNEPITGKQARRCSVKKKKRAKKSPRKNGEKSIKTMGKPGIRFLTQIGGGEHKISERIATKGRSVSTAKKGEGDAMEGKWERTEHQEKTSNQSFSKSYGGPPNAVKKTVGRGGKGSQPRKLKQKCWEGGKKKNLPWTVGGEKKRKKGAKQRGPVLRLGRESIKGKAENRKGSHNRVLSVITREDRKKRMTEQPKEENEPGQNGPTKHTPKNKSKKLAIRQKKGNTKKKTATEIAFV